MKRCKLIAVVLAICAIFVLSVMCAKKKTPTSTTNTTSTTSAIVICPLKVGNYWVFADSSYDSTGAFIFADSSKVGLGGTVTVRYNGNNYLAYLWSWYFAAESLSTTQTGWPMINMNDGLHNIGLIDTVLFNDLRVKYPCAVGNSWIEYGEIRYNPLDSNYQLSSADTITIECISTNQKFVCGIGSISSFVYRKQYNYKSIIKNMNNDYLGLFNTYTCKWKHDPKNIYEFDLYFAPNIGYLGFYEKENGILIHKKTLKRHQIN